MDWFEAMLGFRECAYAEVQRRLAVESGRLLSTVNGQSYGIGVLELLSLQELRARANVQEALPGKLRVTCMSGDIRKFHRDPAFAKATFQVASQFNLLEMTGPSVTPEDGVTRYAADRTQGPACAIAAGAATVYRNYLVPVGAQVGQTSAVQLDGLADLGDALGKSLGLPVSRLWSMRNGYALCTLEGLIDIQNYLTSLPEASVDALRALLRIGVHWDVEVTDQTRSPGPTVTQVFCSALPVAYSRVPAYHWSVFACLVLEAAYEATLWAATCNVYRGGSNIVLLTRLGGGAFGNADAWIDVAIERALARFAKYALDVRLVSFAAPSKAERAMALAHSFAQ